MYTYRLNKRINQSRSLQGALTLPVVGAIATLTLLAGGIIAPLALTHASGGSNPTPTTSPVIVAPVATSTTTTSSTAVTDSVRIYKAYTNATATTGGELLLKAASSDAAAHLFAYRSDGTLIGEVQNGGGSKYGGTVMPYQPYDLKTVTIESSSGGSATAPTTAFQL